MTKSAIAAATLALCTFTGAAPANDSLQHRAMSALGVVIASQGDAALLQIRKELKQSAFDVIKPFLPGPEKAPAPQPDETPAARR